MHHHGTQQDRLRETVRPGCEGGEWERAGADSISGDSENIGGEKPVAAAGAAHFVEQ